MGRDTVQIPVTNIEACSTEQCTQNQVLQFFSKNFLFNSALLLYLKTRLRVR